MQELDTMFFLSQQSTLRSFGMDEVLRVLILEHEVDTLLNQAMEFGAAIKL
uniref:Uncharacterized protein n=1 Tax=Arion vulgaris TaxID=1028688 RepID=A0A0B7B8L8_9EUPU